MQLIYVLMTSLAWRLSRALPLPAAGTPLARHDVMDGHVTFRSADLAGRGGGGGKDSGERVGLIIESLEELRVLPSTNSCYTLDRITRTTDTSGSSVTVSLTLQQVPLTRSRPAAIACRGTLVTSSNSNDVTDRMMSSVAAEAAGKTVDTLTNERLAPLVTNETMASSLGSRSGSLGQLQDYNTYNDTLQGNLLMRQKQLITWSYSLNLDFVRP